MGLEPFMGLVLSQVWDVGAIGQDVPIFWSNGAEQAELLPRGALVGKAEQRDAT